MWDAVTLILLCTANWWVYFEYLATSGFPLTFVTFCIFENLSIFPTSMYTSFEISVFDVTSMLVLLDGLQTCCHYAAHTYLRHTFIGKSHLIHHTNLSPKPHDAFYTGFVDAIVQLILPLYCVLLLVKPSRYSAILFGCMYSWWLLFIHSEPKKEYPWLEFFHLVTPRNHRKHHQTPSTNFSTIFRFSNAQQH